MSELKHTPGTWIYDGLRKVMAGDIVIVDGIKPFSKHGAADAKLIAAAPDMLETLANIIDCYGVGYKENEIHLFVEHLRPFMDDALKVYNKATK